MWIWLGALLCKSIFSLPILGMTWWLRLIFVEFSCRKCRQYCLFVTLFLVLQIYNILKIHKVQIELQFQLVYSETNWHCLNFILTFNRPYCNYNVTTNLINIKVQTIICLQTQWKFHTNLSMPKLSTGTIWIKRYTSFAICHFINLNLSVAMLQFVHQPLCKYLLSIPLILADHMLHITWICWPEVMYPLSMVLLFLLW